MATPAKNAKKPAIKTTAKKTVAPRKTSSKTVKTTVKAPSKKQREIEHRSFRPSKENTPFMTFQFTKQSLYWLILSVLVLGLGAWVMYLNIQIQNIYDQVEMNTYLHETYTIPEHANKTPAAQQ
jgi:hypothetical protein